MKTKQLSLPTPCQENPAGMLESDKGLFCERCDHVVVDFTEWKNEDILSYLQSRGAGRTCGMFHPSQLAPVKRSPFASILKPFRYAALTAIGFFFAKQDVQAQEIKPLPPAPDPTLPISDSIVWVIRGEVKSLKGAAIAGCEVKAINADGNVVATTTTGSDGRYELHLPAGSKAEQFTLRYTATGYKISEMESFSPVGRPVVGVQLEGNSSKRKPIPYKTLGCPSF